MLQSLLLLLAPLQSGLDLLTIPRPSAAFCLEYIPSHGCGNAAASEIHSKVEKPENLSICQRKLKITLQG